MKILEICAAYKPAFVYGGPTLSVSMLSEQLQRAGIQVEVFTTTANGDRELPVKPGEQVIIDQVPVTYFKRLTGDHSHYSPALLRELWKRASEFDVIHIHAWWNLVSIFSCFIALFKKSLVVVSPRGTLSPYSFQNRNSWIKRIIHFAISKPLLNRCAIHVTSQREHTAINQLLMPGRLYDLPNFIKLPSIVNNLSLTKPNYFRLIFFSRIEQKKGLELLIGALPKLEFPFTLTISGGGDAEYIERLKALAIDNQVEDKINWTGFVGEGKFEMLQQHDLFILPSYDENFGNAVIESLSVGTAVLVSKGVGLADYVVENNLGWDCQPDKDSVATAINHIFKKENKMLDSIRNSAGRVIFSDFDECVLVKKYEAMYYDITRQ